MAIGDFVRFDQFKLDMGEKLHDLSSDTFKAAAVKSAANGGIDPTNATPDPRWGAGGSTNLSSSEVAAGGNYAAGGTTLSTTWTLASSKTQFDLSAIIQWLQDGSNPVNARWLIVYNDTDAGKRAVGYIDLGSDIDMSGGDLEYTADATYGLFEIS